MSKRKKGGAGEIRTHDRRVSPNNCFYSLSSGEHLSVLQRFFIVLPRREKLSIPVVHHLSAGAHRHAGLGHSPFTRILKYSSSFK